jgi:hypothetical protein
MRKISGFFAVLVALFTVPAQIGCGSAGADCGKPGQSCMTQQCCVKPDGSVSFERTFSYPNNVQTTTSCTCR